MFEERPRMEVAQEAKAGRGWIRQALWIALPVVSLTYSHLMSGLAPILWGKAPSNIPGAIKAFQIPDGEEAQDGTPNRWSVATELFIDREDGDAIYVFPHSDQPSSPKASPLFRLNLGTGSIDRVTNADPLAFIATHCEGFRRLDQEGAEGHFRLTHTFSGIGLPVFVGPSLIGSGPSWFGMRHWGRDRIALHAGHEDLPLGDIPIPGYFGRFPGIAEAFQDPARRRVLLHADGWLVVLNPPWSHQLPVYPWASIRVSTSDWREGEPNPARPAELVKLDGRWVVEDSLRLEGGTFPLRGISLLVSPPEGFSLLESEAESSGAPPEVTWKDIPQGRVFTISHLPSDGSPLVLPIHFQGPVAIPSALPLAAYSALESPSGRVWFFQAGRISFIQGADAAPPPALEGEPWFNWHWEGALAPARSQTWAPDRRETSESTGMGVVGKRGS